MSERKLRIGVAGATGAVGREIITLLEQAPLPPGSIVPMASPACKVHSIETGGRSIRVENLLVEQLATCDLVFVAVAPQAAAAAIDAVRRSEAPCIDLTGTLGAEQGVVSVVPSVNRGDLQLFREENAVASPRPDVVALATLLAPIRASVGDLRCRGTVMHSAAHFGRGGIEELSNQVVSLFNSRTPQRRIFEQGLAFDLQPFLGELEAGGWTDHELRCARQAAALLRLAPDRLALSSLLGPWFNGLCLSLLVEADVALGVDQVELLLQDAPRISLASGTGLRHQPRPRASDGEASLQVGRLRDDPAGGAVHLWAVADELRFGAAGNAVAILGALLEDDLI